MDKSTNTTDKFAKEEEYNRKELQSQEGERQNGSENNKKY